MYIISIHLHNFKSPTSQIAAKSNILIPFAFILITKRLGYYFFVHKILLFDFSKEQINFKFK